MFLRNCLLVCVLMLLVLFTQACFSLKQVGSPTPESIEITNAENATTVSHFERTKTIHHFIFGLVSPDDVGIEKLVSDEVQLNGGTGAVNVRINYQMTFLNGLVNVITFGVYSPFTLTVEGDVVKWTTKKCTEAGKVYNLEFEAENLSSGIYFYKLETPSRTIHRKMLLIK